MIVDLIYVTNETSKHHFFESVSMFDFRRKCSSPFTGHSTERGVAYYSFTANCIEAIKVSPTLYQIDLRILNHRGHKFSLSLSFLSFKTRIEWPPVLTATANFRMYSFNSCNIQGNVQVSSQGCFGDKNSKTCRFRRAIQLLLKVFIAREVRLELISLIMWSSKLSWNLRQNVRGHPVMD